MSVIMTLLVHGDPQELERRAGGNPEAMREISDRAKAHGLIGHRFFGTDDGRVMVIDEWPDEGSFRAFFEEMGSRIEPLMAEIGVTEPPVPTFWRRLETHDAVGWGE